MVGDRVEDYIVVTYTRLIHPLRDEKWYLVSRKRIPVTNLEKIDK